MTGEASQSDYEQIRSDILAPIKKSKCIIHFWISSDKSILL
ncbi:Uncharacterized protein dnm_085820 [Desulfonema magnum]|uniref:Uncharacterized protein n=1 Tax=Desulfonema magnum TaxID=45655 RepID=A0A975GT08_9BACT|nr:Uncharacterized protein dnm_085820 [Desulfonema magnum]